MAKNKQEIEAHNRLWEKKQYLRKISKGHKREWVIRVFSPEMKEDMVDAYILMVEEDMKGATNEKES